MKRPFFYRLVAVLLVGVGFVACEEKEAEQPPLDRDSLPTLVTQIKQCAKLYTTEFKVHKIITYKDSKSINGEVLGIKIDANLPMSERKIAIPMDATLKAAIDFADFDEYDITLMGNKIEITLPNPELTLTSSKIDHQNIRRHVDLLRGKFSDQELAEIEQNGRNAILAEMGKMNIMSRARLSAANTLIPILSQFGYDKDDIIITFNAETSHKDLKQLLDQSAIENAKAIR